MTSRRQFLIGTASAAGLVGLSGCTTAETTPDAVDWVPASMSPPVSITSLDPATLAGIEGAGLSSENTIFGLAPADMDTFVTVQGPMTARHTGIDGQFDIETAREGITSQFTGSFEEVESYQGYTRLSASDAEVAIAAGRVVISQRSEAATLESIVDARNGATARLTAENTYADRLATAVGPGESVNLSVSMAPADVSPNNTTDATGTSAVAGSGSSLQVGPDTSRFVSAILYATPESADPDAVRQQLNATAVSGLEVTTEDGLVRATGELPTSEISV